MATSDGLSETMAEVLGLSPCLEGDPQAQAAREGLQRLSGTAMGRPNVSTVSNTFLCPFLILSTTAHCKTTHAPEAPENGWTAGPP